MSSLDVPLCRIPDRAISGRVDVACSYIGEGEKIVSRLAGWSDGRRDQAVSAASRARVSKKRMDRSVNGGYMQGRRVVE